MLAFLRSHGNAFDVQLCREIVIRVEKVSGEISHLPKDSLHYVVDGEGGLEEGFGDPSPFYREFPLI